MQSVEGNGNGNGTKPIILGKNVLMPVGVTSAIIGLMLLCASYIKSNITDPISTMQVDVNDIRRTLTDRWTGTNMKMWELEMRRRNPDLNMPNAWDIVNGQRGDEK